MSGVESAPPADAAARRATLLSWLEALARGERPRYPLPIDRDSYAVPVEDLVLLRPPAGSLSADELRAACANVGVDLTCGACAAVFYTGVGLPGDKHACADGRAS